MIHNQPHVRFWLDLLRRPSARARQSAILNLAQVWPATEGSEREEFRNEVVPALVYILRFDPILQARRDASYAIMEMADIAVGAVPALIEALRDADDIVRWYAVVSLHHIGRPAAPALPALI